jgi:hypothetical protein
MVHRDEFVQEGFFTFDQEARDHGARLGRGKTA